MSLSNKFSQLGSQSKFEKRSTMKLGWPATWLRVSSIKSRVSPLAGATSRRDGAVVDSVSDLSVGRSNGLFVAPDAPTRGEGEYPRDFDWMMRGALPGAGGSGVKRSIVKVMNSSCCSFRCFRIVSKIVEIVRSAHWRTFIFSDRASWNKNLQPESIMIACRDLNSARRAPATSKAALRTPRAVSRVESVCCWSFGSRTLTRTRNSSTIEGRPSKRLYISFTKKNVCAHIQGD